MYKGKSIEFLRMVVPSATVFFVGGCVVILGLVASRLVAGALGSSLYTWTSIIGVALTGLSAGSYLGGRVADRHQARRALAVLFGLSSAACVGIVVANNLIACWTWPWRLSWPSHVLVHVTMVFFVPSTLLGMTGPVVAKMALDQRLAMGHTIGSIYAWGAAGGIAGIFLAGFYLIPTFGNTAILWGIGAAMLAMAVLYWISCWAMYLWAMVFAALATTGMSPVDWARDAGVAAFLREPSDPNVLYDVETAYCRLMVKQISRYPDRREFWQDQFLRRETVLDDVTNLQHFYTRIYAALTHGLAGDKGSLSTMIIGGRDYAFPRYLQDHWPQSFVEVVEIDPGVTRAAVEAFGLDEIAPIRTIHRDARNYVNQLLVPLRGDESPERYDFIYKDAFQGYSVPFALVTREFNEKIHGLLKKRGVYLVSLIDARDGGEFLGAVYNTLRETFDHVYIVTSPGPLPASESTFVVVAAGHEIDLPSVIRTYNPHLKFRVFSEAETDSIREKCGWIILTDDFAPVENMLAPVVRQGARERLAQRVVHRAEVLQRSGQFEQSIALYERASGLDPWKSIRANREIAAMKLDQGDLDGAAAALREAIRYQETADTYEPAIASVHYGLGVLLRRMGDSQQALKHLEQAARWARIELEVSPRSVFVWDQLGEVLATMGRYREASDAFEKAVYLDATNPARYERLARALEFQQRYGEAIAVLREQIKLLQDRGERDRVSQLRQHVELLEYRNVKQSK